MPIFQPAELTASIAKFRKLFADGSCYLAAIPTYVGGHMAMGWATDNAKLRRTPIRPSPTATRRPAASPPSTGPRGARGGIRAARFIADKVAKAGKR